MNKLKLEIELVPESSWKNNIRNLLGKKAWKKLRIKVTDDFNHSCGICGVRDKILHCHEIWKYDDKKHVQKLEGFIPLCKMCHAIKHIGYAKIQSDRGELNWEKMIRHFAKVNNCDRKIFEKYYQKSAIKWTRRSKYKWKVYIGKFDLGSL